MKEKFCSLLVRVRKPHVIDRAKCYMRGICNGVCPDKCFAVVNNIGIYYQVQVA